DTSETGSPVCGTDGNHLNDAEGGRTNAGVTAGASVTTNVTGALLPAGFPSELSCVATAVYCPLPRAGLASSEVQPAPVPVAVALETRVPLAVAPAWIWTVTGVVSLAVPLKDGVVSNEGEKYRARTEVGAREGGGK